MTKKLHEYITKGQFEEAKTITNGLPHSELVRELKESVSHDAGITHYSFIMSLLVEEENVHLHEMAFGLMVKPLSTLDGAYYAALYHARRCVELTEGQDIGYLSNLLFLHGVPGNVVSDEEACDTARRLLALDPDYTLAHEWLKRR
ncbi:hypothetical protein HF072_04325 [Bacillus sp. RO3]|nr:hypothetical protein [Bacillus sp. RO3]